MTGSPQHPGTTRTATHATGRGARRGATRSRPARSWRSPLPAAAAWKFEAPAAPERELARDELVRRMESHLGSPFSRGNAFVLAAPPGYGKTTVIGQWARQTALPVAWYALEASDDDPVVFVRGLMRALEPVAPEAAWRVSSALALLPTGVLGKDDLERVKVRLLDDLRRILDRPVALVLTNVTALGAGRAAHGLLGALLAQLPDHLRLVVEAHTLPRLPLSPLYMDHRLEGLGKEELALDEDEVARLLALYEVALAPEQIARLQRLCGGWIAGVLLATDAGAPAFLAQSHPTDFNRQAVFDYLAAHVLDALPPAVLEFAMAVAVLDPITPALANGLLEMEDARERLAALEQRTGFLVRVGVGAGEPVYRLQPLLRQALLVRLKRDHGLEHRRALHERAARLLEEAEEYDQAVDHYAHARRYDRVSALIEARRGALLRAGRGATLAKWIAMLPPDQRQAEPHQQLLLAELYRYAGRTQCAWQAVRKVCRQALAEPERDPELTAQALVLRAELCFARGRIAQARRDAARALALLTHTAERDEAHDQLQRADETRLNASFVLAASQSALGNPAGADACLTQIEAAARRTRDVWALSRLLYLRSCFAMRSARYSEAERLAQQALRCGQEANDEVGSICSRLNLCVLRASRGAFAQARDDLQTAMEQSRRAGYALGRAYALCNLGDLERLEGNYEAALVAYQRASDAAEHLGDAQIRVAAQSWLGLTLALLGRSDDTVQLLEPLSSNSATTTAEFSSNALLSLGIAHYQARDFARALQVLEAARERASADGFRMTVVRANVFLAATHLALEQLSQARAALRGALDQVSAFEDIAPVLLPNVQLVPELRPLLEWMDDPRARNLARAFRERSSALATGHSLASAATSDDPVRVFALGGARVYTGEDLVEHWRLPAAREMLCYMLDRGEPVRKEALLDALWPDKSEDLANLNFRQAVFQLKRALGRSGLKKVQGRWQLAVECWADTREFERLAAEGEQLAASGAFDEAEATLRQALTYYAGPYLEDVYNEWAVVRREELHLRRLALLERLAEVEEHLGHYDQAAQHYFEVLDDPAMHESAYRGLMRHFARRREFARVREQFERCARELGPELAPSAETKALYHELLAQAQTLPEVKSRAE